MTAAARRLRSPWLLASLAWIGLLLLFFFPVVFQGKVLAPLDILDHLMRPWSDGAGGFGVHNAFVYDAISQYLPYDWAVFQSIRQDGYIGWNPYVYGGYALLENTMLCPGDWHHQLYRFFDFWTAWDLGIILQFAIAGFGVLLMLRGEDIPAWAALVGAVSFAFYSQHVLWIYHRWVLGASCWFPWIVWAIRRARRENRLFDFWSVAVTALAFRGGSLQSCLFVVLLFLGLFLADLRAFRRHTDHRGTARMVVLYATTSLFSSLLVADVLLDTIPPFLEGCRELSHKGFLACLKPLPFLASSVFPTALGTPQTMDVGKVFGTGLFDIKYAGTIPLVLALFAFLRKDAPFAPKLLAVLSLGLAYTPLVNWFYARSTVVFGLGVTWLAAWELANVRNNTFHATAWRWTARVFAAALALWTVAGIAVRLFAPRLAPILHAFVEKSLSADKSSRLDWMLARSDAFLAAFPPWSITNALPLLAVALGLSAVWQYSRSSAHKNRRVTAWLAVAIVCAFGETFAWSRTWITFSKPPAAEPDRLYEDLPWTTALRKEMECGGFLWVHNERPDFDYFQLNAQSGIGIPSLQGYETIRPRTLPFAPSETNYNTAAFAAAGVSHVLVMPDQAVPPGLADWIEVVDTKDLHLFRNPAFRSLFLARLADGSEIPLCADAQTPNSIHLVLPAGTQSLRIAMTHHPAWRYRIGDGSWNPLPPSSDGLLASEISLPASLQQVTKLHLRFR